MFERFITLFFASLALGGCASSMDYSLDRKADGTTKVTEKSSCVGLLCGTAAVRSQATVIAVPMAPTFNYERYGRDHYYSGYSHNPTPPVPYVTYGRMLSGSIREAFVDGTRRICDIRPTAPNHCNRVDEANGWPRR